MPNQIIRWHGVHRYLQHCKKDTANFVWCYYPKRTIQISCDSANSWIICGRFRAVEQLEHKRVPLPQRYWRRRDQRSGWVMFLSSHNSTSSVYWAKARVHPTSGHHATCLHNSLHSWQLGHIGLLLFWCARNFILPAIPRTCLAALTWHSWGRSWSVWWTDIQSMELNWLWDSIFWSW